MQNTLVKTQSAVLTAILAATNAAQAGDPTYLLDVYDMTVGTRLGEGLIVAESCIDPADTSTTCTKAKYVTALPGRTGRIEFAINVAGSFDVSMNVDNNESSGGSEWGESLSVYSSGGDSLEFPLLWNDWQGIHISCRSTASDDTGGLAGSGYLNGYASGYTSNDLRIAVENGKANCYCNNTIVINASSIPSPVVLAAPQRPYNRLAVSGINDKDRLYEVKVRGLPGAGSGACGDVNDDNASTIVDALIVARHDLGLAVTGSCFNQ